MKGKMTMTPKVNSILPPEMRGVMKITGYRGIGKSFLAAQADVPQNIAYFDFEQKGEGIHRQMNFGLYRALTREAKRGDPVDLYNVTMDAFANLEQDRYTVAVLDNISPLELAMNAEGRRGAREYAQEFGLNLKNILANRFGGTKSIVNFMISTRISNVLHARGVRLIIAVSHIGSRWGVGGPIPNKYREKGADRWQELSILSLVLIPGEFAPVPAALVQKEQLGLIAWDEMKQEHVIRRRLPWRIPKCTFAEIRRYLREPADLENPAPGEIPLDDETNPFSEKLSREQINLMTLALQKEQREQAELSTLDVASAAQASAAQPLPMPEIDDDTKATIVTMKNSGMSYKQIAEHADIRELGLTVPMVVKICKGE